MNEKQKFNIFTWLNASSSIEQWIDGLRIFAQCQKRFFIFSQNHTIFLSSPPTQLLVSFLIYAKTPTRHLTLL
jgi:hypothetical protein